MAKLFGNPKAMRGLAKMFQAMIDVINSAIKALQAAIAVLETVSHFGGAWVRTLIKALRALITTLKGLISGLQEFVKVLGTNAAEQESASAPKGSPSPGGGPRAGGSGGGGAGGGSAGADGKTDKFSEFMAKLKEALDLAKSFTEEKQDGSAGIAIPAPVPPPPPITPLPDTGSLPTPLAPVGSDQAQPGQYEAALNPPFQPGAGDPGSAPGGPSLADKSPLGGGGGGGEQVAGPSGDGPPVQKTSFNPEGALLGTVGGQPGPVDPPVRVHRTPTADNTFANLLGGGAILAGTTGITAAVVADNKRPDGPIEESPALA